MSLIDYGQVSTCSELGKVKEPAILAALSVSIALMANLPLSTTWQAKAIISHALTGNFIHFITVFLSLMTICSIPLKGYFSAAKITDLNLGLYNKISLYFMTFIALVVGFFGQNIPVIKNIYKVSILSFDTLKQLVIIAAAVCIIYFIKITKKHYTSLNLIEWLGEMFFSIYCFYQASFKSKDKKELWSFKSLERQTHGRLAAIHNQQTAIFVVFSVLLVMLYHFQN
jgi:hypothetical protein